MLIFSPWIKFFYQDDLFVQYPEQGKKNVTLCPPSTGALLNWNDFALSICGCIPSVCLVQPAGLILNILAGLRERSCLPSSCKSAAFFFFVRALVSLTRASCSGLWASGREWGKEKKIRLGIFTPDKTILSRGTSGPTPGDAWPPIIARTLCSWVVHIRALNEQNANKPEDNYDSHTIHVLP